MMHLNRYGLQSKGYRMVASYTCITKGQKALNIECYTNSKEYLVRQWKTGEHAWDIVYTDKNAANAKVISLRKQYNWYKRTI